MVGATLEWLTDTCPYIGIYTASRFSLAAPCQAYIDASLSESLRGEAPKTFSFPYPTCNGKNNKADCVLEEGEKFLIFLRDAGKADIRSEQVINLTCPASQGWEHVALRPDFSLLRDGAAIEKVVRQRIVEGQLTAMPWRAYPENRFDIEVPLDTPAFQALYGGSSSFLIVPADFLKQSSAVQEPQK